MRMKAIKLIFKFCFFALCASCEGYRILGVFPFNARSHNILFEALMKGLAKRGHQVDVISHYPQKEPIVNYNDIVSLKGSMDDITNCFTLKNLDRIANQDLPGIAEQLGNQLCDFLGFEKMQEFIRNPPKNPAYDLVITEAFGSNCYFGLGYVFKVPVVAISSGMEFPWISHYIGNDDNPAYVPNYYHVGTQQINFFDRMKNIVYNYLYVRRFHELTEKYQTDSMRKYLDPNIPNVRVVEKNVALTLVNSHHVLFGVKPVIPSLIQIAGLHVELGNETLPAELKNWMDASSSGVVYFSFGSMVLIETLESKTLREIFASFEKISPVRVLLKIFDSTMLPSGLPANVKIIPWMPQQAVLAHPHTKVFITHGGLGGSQEALYYGIPMIGIPLFADQFRNVQSFVDKRMAVKIDYEKLNEKSMDAALSAMLNDSTYKQRAMYYSKLFRDDPLGPMDRAGFWIEYVIRNGGDTLKSPALKLSYMELNLLDIYLTIFLVLTCILFVFYWCSRLIFTFLMLRNIAIRKISK